MSSREFGGADIESWILSYLGSLLGIPSETLDAGASMVDLGLDSAMVVALSADLEEWLGVELDPGMLLEAPSIGGLARSVAETLAGPR